MMQDTPIQKLDFGANPQTKRAAMRAPPVRRPLRSRLSTFTFRNPTLKPKEMNHGKAL